MIPSGSQTNPGRHGNGQRDARGREKRGKRDERTRSRLWKREEGEDRGKEVKRAGRTVEEKG